MRDRTEDQITLVMIRHGATRANREHRYLGRTDEGLDEESRRELRDSRERNYYPDVEYVFTSPMKRCAQTAQILYPDRVVYPVPEWREIDFGAFEGKTYEELKDDERYQAWIDSNGTLPFPEGESREEFMLRSEQGFHRMKKLLRQLAQERGKEITTVGMVVHGGTIMSLLSRFHGGQYFDYQVPNTKGYICKLKIFGKETETEITDIAKL